MSAKKYGLPSPAPRLVGRWVIATMTQLISTISNIPFVPPAVRLGEAAGWKRMAKEVGDDSLVEYCRVTAFS